MDKCSCDMNDVNKGDFWLRKKSVGADLVAYCESN